MRENLTFGQAIEAVKEGNLIARKGWNGKDMFVFQRPEDHLEVEMIVHKVKSLPQSIKDYYAQQNEKGLDGSAKIKFTSYLCMKAADGSIVNGWLASQTDMLSNDWCVIDLK